MEPPPASPAAGSASLLVIDPQGHRTRVPVNTLPFHIGRQPSSDLILRDSRVSRTHARILFEEGRYVLEDAGSTHGTFLNGTAVKRHVLVSSDRIEFGSQDSYQLVFAVDGAELKRLIDQVGATEAAPAPGIGSNLAKLRAILDLARTVQSGFSTEDVLASVVDTALAITGAERGFLLLRAGPQLETRVARHRLGYRLDENQLRVPRQVIHRALQNRRELLAMNFDPNESGDPQSSVADLDLRSVICVPLVRIRTGRGDATSVLAAGSETVGVLYMDSRDAAVDMAGGNRELLQTLAIETSTVLENARLLEEERAKLHLEEELNLARTIQQSLLPGKMPVSGWVCARGSSIASHQVGGDYFDATVVDPARFSAVVADVSGKGVGSALLACLLQGALIASTGTPEGLSRRVARLNTFLLDRTGGEKYATLFYCLLDDGGDLAYINAAHCPPYVVRPGAEPLPLDTSAVPVGLIEGADFPVETYRLEQGDKLVIYTDGVTEAQNTTGGFFGKKRLRAVLSDNASRGCDDIHDAVQDAVTAFTEGAPQSDDITVLVLEFCGR